jgi:hypothetical protein
MRSITSRCNRPEARTARPPAAERDVRRTRDLLSSTPRGGKAHEDRVDIDPTDIREGMTLELRWTDATDRFGECSLPVFGPPSTRG